MISTAGVSLFTVCEIVSPPFVVTSAVIASPPTSIFVSAPFAVAARSPAARVTTTSGSELEIELF
ncbi:MAG: hypothetical protein EBU67_09940 [Actinobacteria bacterium]|nr:hypothetical protein [Actinomycetota bacterium]